jgi:hypothetical protein
MHGDEIEVSIKIFQRFCLKTHKMDTSGCLEGFATDVAFESPNSEIQCKTTLALYWSLCAIFLSLRFIALAKQFLNWKTSNARRNRKNQLPVAVSVSAVQLVMNVILWILIGTNVVNVYNGGAWSLLSLVFLPFAFISTVILLRTVRLGSKIIPLARDIGDASLRLFTLFGKVLIFVQLFSILSATLTLIILSPVFPNMHDLLGRIGFASKAIYLTSFCSGMVMQFQRCINAIRKVENRIEDFVIQQETPSVTGASGAPTTDKPHLVRYQKQVRETNYAIKLMRQHQTVFLVAWVFGAIEWFLIAAGLFQWSTFVIYVYAFVYETVSSLFVEFVLMNTSNHKKNKRKPQVVIEKAQDQAVEAKATPFQAQAIAVYTTPEMQIQAGSLPSSPSRFVSKEPLSGMSSPSASAQLEL